jgi:hypothetical protein
MMSVKIRTPTMIEFRIWSTAHGQWLKPESKGYTPDLSEAGLFPQSRAIGICSQAGLNEQGVPEKTLVPAGELGEPDLAKISQQIRAEREAAPMMLCEYTLQRIDAADPRYADDLPLCKAAADLVEAGKLTLDELGHDHPRTGQFMTSARLSDSLLEDIRSTFSSFSSISSRGEMGTFPVVNPWETMAVLEELALHARFVPAMLEEYRTTLKKAGHTEPPAWYEPKEEPPGPFKIEGQYLAGEDFESGPYPTWAEADAAFHQMRLARIDGTLPPVKSQRIVPTVVATA